MSMGALQSCALLLAAFLPAACVSSGAKGGAPGPKLPPAPVMSEAQRAWRPPAPDPKRKDWIQLKSGEWLAGKFTSMRRDTLDFDSEKLDELSLDWSDIVEVRSSRRNTVVFEDRVTAAGTLLVRDGVVIVGSEEGERRFSRKDVVSIVPGEPEEASLWSGKVSLGLTARSGNTDQTELSSLINLRRRGPFSRIDLKYLGTFGKLEGEENVNNQRFTGRWDLYVSKRWYVTPVSLDLFRDPFQNVGLRATPAAGGGYTVIDNSRLEWEVNLAAGWRLTRLDSVAPGEIRDDATAALIPGTKLKWDITRKTEFSLSYWAEIGVPDTTDTNQHLAATLSIDVIGDLDLDVSFIWDRVGSPQRASDGVVPENDDFRLTVGFGWKF